MPQSKSIPKERHDRQRAGRAIRQGLVAITPDESHRQEQCRLFAVLLVEIRFIIFQLALSQRYKPNTAINKRVLLPIYRPCHHSDTTVDLNLLLTCRRIYCEAQSIPLRSATHHFHDPGSTSFLGNADIWLHHVTKRRGMDLYHLHANLATLDPVPFSKFFLPHLHWRRISWTICSYAIPPIQAEEKEKEKDNLARTLESLIIPASCQEVTLDVEACNDPSSIWNSQAEQISSCRQIALKKSDGSVLHSDPKYAFDYFSYRSRQLPRHTAEAAWLSPDKMYTTARLCWRASVPRRDYMSYDYLDCLDVVAEARVGQDKG